MTTFDEAAKKFIEGAKELNEVAKKVNQKYRNENCQKRDCDFCGKPYRGPAVYCSLECALADA
jgi:hypothetical protein